MILFTTVSVLWLMRHSLESPTLVCVHLELVIVGPVAVTSAVSMLAAAAAATAVVVIPFPPDMTSGEMVRSKDCPTIKTEAGATTEDRSEDAEC